MFWQPISVLDKTEFFLATEKLYIRAQLNNCVNRRSVRGLEIYCDMATINCYSNTETFPNFSRLILRAVNHRDNNSACNYSLSVHYILTALSETTGH
jgi:hypothetical protein